MSTEHRAFESLLLMAWLIIIYVIARVVAMRVTRIRWGADMLAATGVLLFLFGSAWHPTTRLQAAQVVAEQPPPTASAPTARIAGRSITCPTGARVQSGGDGHIDVVRVGDGGPESSAAITLRPGQAIHVGGWAAFRGRPSKTACLVVDGRIFAATGLYGITRADVAAAFGKPAMVATGFDLTATLPAGRHRIGVAAVDGSLIDAIVQEIPVVVH